MNIGDYVRTKDGRIFRWNKLCTISIEDYMEHTRKILYIEDEIKSSPNIIDLIEENDFVEIEYYSNRYKERVSRIFEVTYKDERYINLSNAKCEFMLIENDFTESDKVLKPIIKSIVTHEMFESMEYKIGE